MSFHHYSSPLPRHHYLSPTSNSLPRSGAAVVTRQHARVDHTHFACTHGRQALLDRGQQVGRLRNRTYAIRAHHARHAGNIDVGLGDVLPDPAIFRRTPALLRHASLVPLVVVERAVVADDHEAGYLVVGRGPHRGIAH